MEVQHPQALGDESEVPASEELRRETYDVEEGTLEVPDRSTASTLARKYGVALSAIIVDAGTCTETIDSGDRAGEECGRDLPCQYHSED